MATYTFSDLAREALQRAQRPLERRELWTFAEKEGLTKRLETGGKTPWETLGARLYVSLAEDPQSPFLRVGARPTRFWLRSRELPKGWDGTGPLDETALANDVASAPATPKRVTVHERELHPRVALFAFEKLGQLRVKTVRHENSKKGTFGEWVHPDLIGVRFPMVGLDATTAAFSTAVQASLLRLFSFELKKRLDFGNLREAFFQAVSNSSWANEAYLVAGELPEDGDFLDELQRLSSAFGIGVINLGLDGSEARVVFPARRRDEVDWITLDKLVVMNPDVRGFLDNVRIDAAANKIHASEYDPILSEAALPSPRLRG
jgi:hypothetical protein